MPSGRLVVHAPAVDGLQATARPDVDVVIEGHRIAAVEPHRSALHEGAVVVDAAEQSVMPGLIEGHGHTLKAHGDLFGRVHLAYGITSFRDVGAQPYDALEDKEAIESGRRVGPRVFTTGYLLDGARTYYPMASTAPDEAAVDLEIERARRLDYDMFKTYVRLPDLLQRRAIDGAHAIGIPTSSHGIYPAALSGGDSVEHAGATSRRGYSTKQSLTGRAYEDVIQIVSRSGMTFTPTLALGGFQAAVARDPSLLDDPRWKLLQPPWTDASARARPAGAAQNPRVRAGQQRTALALQRAGATLIAGVDSPLTPYGTALHLELEDLVAAGLTPFEALKTATINTAALMGAGADLGTVVPGKLADLVIVDGNPLVNIADTRRVRKVVRNGEVLTLERLLDVPGAHASHRDRREGSQVSLTPAGPAATKMSMSRSLTRRRCCTGTISHLRFRVCERQRRVDALFTRDLLPQSGPGAPLPGLFLFVDRSDSRGRSDGQLRASAASDGGMGVLLALPS